MFVRSRPFQLPAKLSHITTLEVSQIAPYRNRPILYDSALCLQLCLSRNGQAASGVGRTARSDRATRSRTVHSTNELVGWCQTELTKVRQPNSPRQQATSKIWDVPLALKQRGLSQTQSRFPSYRDRQGVRSILASANEAARSYRKVASLSEEATESPRCVNSGAIP